MTVRFAGIAALVVLVSCAAGADEPDKSGYTLFDPTPDDLMRKFERP